MADDKDTITITKAELQKLLDKHRALQEHMDRVQGALTTQWWTLSDIVSRSLKS